MRRVELICGVLAGVLGLAALALALTQHPTRMFTGMVSYGALTSGASPASETISETMRSLLLSAALAVVACLLVALAAVQDARSRATRSRATRSPWRWVALLAACATIVGVYLLVLSEIYVGFGGSGPFYQFEVSASLLFAPAMLAAIFCALAALAPRRAQPSPAPA